MARRGPLESQAYIDGMRAGALRVKSFFENSCSGNIDAAVARIDTIADMLEATLHDQYKGINWDAVGRPGMTTRG